MGFAGSGYYPHMNLDLFTVLFWVSHACQGDAGDTVCNPFLGRDPGWLGFYLSAPIHSWNVSTLCTTEQDSPLMNCSTVPLLQSPGNPRPTVILGVALGQTVPSSSPAYIQLERPAPMLSVMPPLQGCPRRPSLIRVSSHALC